ncbi:hypothetical protein [Streptomyces sp. SAJ15]|uniref:hypothetical protein n=1 Tax=Streptomyces sp. SAJ15 TaxID=2011095 RepID=UPI0011853CCA|nr:hypothetical protein [Streptomyces sp. SAJ15]TVL90359.1 hypothetical protein CD790_22975 [Streptomyces sp. SAJ15]
MSAKLVVYPPDENGRRRVRYEGSDVGVAQRPSDVAAFAAAAGRTGAEDLDLTDPRCVEWRGGGPETWAEEP